jgi:hypothetical protein
MRLILISLELAEIFHHSPSTLFDVRTFVLRLKFRNWKWIPHFLLDDEKKASVNGRIRGDFVGQSTRAKSVKLLDKGRVTDYAG